jgi:hypothetical protein
MNLKTALLAAVAVFSLASPNLVAAQNIKGPAQITASTTIIQEPGSPAATISKAVDGNASDASPYAGFVGTNDSLGKIDFVFDRPYDVRSFHLANDVNVYKESVSRFTLKFFNSANVQIGGPMAFNTVQGRLAQQNFHFPSAANVSRVEMVVNSVFTDSGFRRVEIREVSFSGKPTSSHAPLPSAMPPLNLPATAKIISLKSTDMTVAANGGRPAETQAVITPTGPNQPSTGMKPTIQLTLGGLNVASRDI